MSSVPRSWPPVTLAVPIALAACTSSPSTPPADAGAPPASSCGSTGIASLPSSTIVNASAGVVWDATGLILAGFQGEGGPNVVVSVPIAVANGVLSAEAASTLVTVPSPGYIGQIASDGTNVYYAITIGAPEIYSVPRGGGTPTAIFSPAGGSIDGFAMGSGRLYVTYETAGSIEIVAVPTTGGAQTVLYTAPANQVITDLALFGGVLYWAESAQILTPPTVTTIRWAVASASPFSPGEYATVPTGTTVAELVAPSAAPTSGGAASTLYFAATPPEGGGDAGGVPLVGIFSLALGGAPQLLDGAGSPPMIGFESVLLYSRTPGISQYDMTTGTESSVASTGDGEDSIAANATFAGSATPELVYTQGACVDAVQGWTPPSP